ncbi:hypothetical protein DYBT9275_04956 [Dyadobacter sp. CECT 9275]|uniref:Phosphatidic acid phosphatase type 2/haloperoxidase domain-containing protein n=1 Tax=Dyadobacter helix TaxID=2822344 RepID=A0A916JG30_9BACT|nr:phosphatase PAP2 family protein [Dyadobacter sp. CECT 9275]CAG5011468.1 hypothetical protein DYBT9275_04956 [Dyadobacter sp. CECT 9275]
MKSFWTEQRSFLIPFLCIWVMYASYQLFHSQTDMLIHINAHWSPLGDAVFPFITYWGDGWFSMGIGLLMLLFSVRPGLCVILSYASSGIFAQLLKKFIFTDFYRPPKVLASVLPSLHQVSGVALHEFGSFPSGHTTSAFALFATLAFSSKSNLVKPFLLLPPILVAYSRMYLLAHFPEDVLAGAMIGVVFSVLTWCLIFKKK